MQMVNYTKPIITTSMIIQLMIRRRVHCAIYTNSLSNEPYESRMWQNRHLVFFGRSTSFVTIIDAHHRQIDRSFKIIIYCFRWSSSLLPSWQWLLQNPLRTIWLLRSFLLLILLLLYLHILLLWSTLMLLLLLSANH